MLSASVVSKTLSQYSVPLSPLAHRSKALLQFKAMPLQFRVTQHQCRATRLQSKATQLQSRATQLQSKTTRLQFKLAMQHRCKATDHHAIAVETLLVHRSIHLCRATVRQLVSQFTVARSQVELLSTVVLLKEASLTHQRLQ